MVSWFKQLVKATFCYFLADSEYKKDVYLLDLFRILYNLSRFALGHVFSTNLSLSIEKKRQFWLQDLFVSSKSHTEICAILPF